MPDDLGGSSHVSLRLPNEVIQSLDRLAALLERPRSWVMLRAMRHYLDAEGAELLEDAESLAQLDRGESAPFADSLRDIEAVIRKAEAKRVRKK
jgi:predicted transcriptional regulator